MFPAKCNKNEHEYAFHRPYITNAMFIIHNATSFWGTPPDPYWDFALDPLGTSTPGLPECVVQNISLGQN